jgi:hypothetical protein
MPLTSSNVTIKNTANWVVSIANTVAGGSIVQISNSANWVVYVANTIAGGDAVTITNSAGWVVSVANTGGSYAMSNTLGSYAITNTAGWSVAVSGTPTILITNTAGVTVTNTAAVYVVGTPSFSITNTANWGVKITSGSVYVVNTGPIYITNTVGLVSTYDSSFAYDATTKCTPKYALIAASASGNYCVVRDVSNKKIRVLSAFLMSNSANKIIWQSNSATATNLTGVAFLVDNVGYVLPHNPHGWFQTGTSSVLNLAVHATNSIGGCLTYIETS